MTMRRGPALIVGIIATVVVAIGLGLHARGAFGSRNNSRCDDPPPTVRIAHSNVSKEAPGRRVLPVGLFADAALVRMGRNGIFNPALASRWETRDRRIWTFTVREHLRTQQGVPLTAQTIVEALRDGISSIGSDPVARDLLRIDSPTPDTIVIELARPSSVFLEGLSMMQIATTSGNPSLYAGPFRLIRQSDEEMAFAAFPDTWSGKPTVSGVHVQFFPTPRAAWAALLRDEADFLTDVPVESTLLLATNPDIRLIPYGEGNVFTLGFNVRHPLLRDVRARIALNVAIDRRAIVNRFFGEYSYPARGPFSREFRAAAEEDEPWLYEPLQARELLKAATGGRTTPIELVCITNNQLTTSADMAAMVAAQLEQVNVQVRLVGLPADEFNARMAKGDFDLFAAPLPVGPTGFWSYAFWHSNPHPLADTGYTAADAALEALYTATSATAETAAARVLRGVFRRDPPAVFVAPIPNLAAVRRNWRIPDDEPNMISSLPRWTLMETAGCGPT